ncbi:MAG: hypothetical protein K0U93_00015 [Gammaproteobacteria bacterium]|nr:hypothetical protein [Gammaproteobacteria bacterium]
MLGKILITALVIAVAVLVTRARGASGQNAAAGTRVGQSSDDEPPRISSRTLAYVIVIALFGGAAMFYFQHWQSWHEVVDVRVVNTQNGEVAEYKVHKGTIQDRSFKTVDGWKVTVSDLERLEMLNPN